MTRKFVTIAAILATRPQYMILDEPTAGQDLTGIKVLTRVLGELEKKEIGVVTITHDMEFAANNFERVVAMANKKIIKDGNVRDIFRDDDILWQSKIKRPQIGQIADSIGLGKDILNAREFVKRYKEVRVS